MFARLSASLGGRLRKVASVFRAQALRFTRVGVFVGRGVRIGPRMTVSCTGQASISLHEGVSLVGDGSLVAVGGKIEIGEATFIGRWTAIVCREAISIGRDCLIAERVTIRDQDHEIYGDPSKPIGAAGFRSSAVRIGCGTWIGAGVVILKGVTLGRGVVVAANSVVNRDFGDFEIVAGAPARSLGSRLDAKTPA